MTKAIITKHAEVGSKVELPNGKVIAISRDADSLIAVQAILEALDIEVEYAGFNLRE